MTNKLHVYKSMKWPDGGYRSGREMVLIGSFGSEDEAWRWIEMNVLRGFPLTRSGWRVVIMTEDGDAPVTLSGGRRLGFKFKPYRSERGLDIYRIIYQRCLEGRKTA